MRASMYLAINIVAISRDDIIYYCLFHCISLCCRNFRYYASGNSRYGCAIMLQETVVTTALRLNFEFLTDAAEREQRVLAHFAEPRGGNEDLFLVILNFEFHIVYL